MYNFALRNPHFKITASPQKAATLVRHFYKETVVIINIRQLIWFFDKFKHGSTVFIQILFFFSNFRAINGSPLHANCVSVTRLIRFNKKK